MFRFSFWVMFLILCHFTINFDIFVETKTYAQRFFQFLLYFLFEHWMFTCLVSCEWHLTILFKMFNLVSDLCPFRQISLLWRKHFTIISKENQFEPFWNIVHIKYKIKQSYKIIFQMSWNHTTDLKLWSDASFVRFAEALICSL